MRTPPTLMNSAVTSGAPISLIRWARAPGNVFSIPKTMPTFLFIGIRLRAWQLQRTHQGPGGPRRLPERLAAFLFASTGTPCGVPFRVYRNALRRSFSRQIRLGHFLPPRPVVPHAAPDVEAVWDMFGRQQVRHPFVVAKADVVFAGRQDPFVPAVPVEVPGVGQPGQEIRRTEEVTVLIVVTVEERVDVVG